MTGNIALEGTSDRLGELLGSWLLDVDSVPLPSAPLSPEGMQSLLAGYKIQQRWYWRALRKLRYLGRKPITNS